jgi:hypothetical protein
LSGKHRRNKTAEGTRQLAGWNEPPVRDENTLWAIVNELVAIGDAHGVSGAQIALAWLLGRPAVTSAIIGGRTEAQFRDNLACVKVRLTDDERSRLDKVSQPPAYLSLLAPVLDSEGPPRPGRPGVARALSQGLSTPSLASTRFGRRWRRRAFGRTPASGRAMADEDYRLDRMWFRSTG